ncbi:MAG: large conductance mechanosensitive channel protein MscL [Micavibrio sp.]|nr:large conductance mechanosensitive channel protein MscL [Micavibrio sp.]|tara:strand:+ start:3147 stop:3593 length:447 start_codon:yes stop_codon:yes gene_type:complete
MKVLEEFKSFIARGNVMDMAVGIIMGAAFTAIVTSMVGDMIMPVVGMVTGGMDFSALYLNLSGQDYPSLAAAQEAGAATINYGVFLNAVINFLIVSFVVFILVKNVNRIKEIAAKKEAADAEKAPVTPPADILLLSEIRDLLKKQNKK